MPNPPVLVYLHGFNSSPDALKALQVADYIRQRQLNIDYLRPSIPDTPDEAKAFLEDMLADLWDRKVSVIGSSLGGYYATWLGECLDLNVVLVNPAIRPHELLHKYIGPNKNPCSGADYQLTAGHIGTLQSLYISTLSRPEKRLILLQTGDEVLSAVEASQRFYQSTCFIEYGGTHSFQGFEKYIPGIFSWLALE